MVQRHAATTFGESYAFPGGLVDDEDRAAHAHCGGRTAGAADRLLNLPDNALDYFSAAARELFEESGVLLARDARGDWAFQGRQAQQAQLREQLVAGERRWSQLLREHRLQVACDALHYIGHWETPLQLPKRFSARFFVAAKPAGQQAQHDGDELTDGRWMSAADVLAHARDKAMQVRFPTLKNLQLIAQHESLPDLLGWADSRAAHGIDCIRPEIIEIDGTPSPVLPGDPGYPCQDDA
jgi:8-oxo-dGTP pyrophosphatase MutT (NUDIX family)